MIRVSVSNLDKYAAYLNDEDFSLDMLLRDLRGQTPRTPAMERGHAFAKAMEQLPTLNAPFSLITAEGHAFAFTCDVELEAWPRRELKAEKDYGGIIVSARCDRLLGKIIADDKSTSHFSGDAGVEKYIDKKQWRYYLDSSSGIFGRLAKSTRMELPASRQRGKYSLTTSSETIAIPNWRLSAVSSPLSSANLQRGSVYDYIFHCNP